MLETLLPIEQLLLWPVWWYSQGLWWLIQKVGMFLRHRAKSLNLVVWAKNLLVPMFGENDLASRIISFVVRFFMIIISFIGWLFFLSVGVTAILLWVVMPPLIIYLVIGFFI